MMKFGAYIPLSGKPFPHDPRDFPKLKKWQLVAALEVVHNYVKEGKVLGPFPGSTRFCPVTGKPLVFYPSFVVPNSTPGSFRCILNASHNAGGPSIIDRIYDLVENKGSNGISLSQAAKAMTPKQGFKQALDSQRMSFKQFVQLWPEFELAGHGQATQIVIAAPRQRRGPLDLFAQKPIV